MTDTQQQVDDQYLDDRTLDLALQALLRDYSATREDVQVAAGSLRSFENFTIVVLAAAIAGLPTILANQLYFLFPMISMVVSLLAVIHRHQGWLYIQLELYQSEVLRPQLAELMQQSSQEKPLSESVLKLWAGPSYYRARRLGGPLLIRLGRRIAHARMGTLFLLCSMGFFLLFFHYRGYTQLTVLEVVLLVFAGLYTLLMVTLQVRSVFVELGELLRKQPRE